MVGSVGGDKGTVWVGEVNVCMPDVCISVQSIQYCVCMHMCCACGTGPFVCCVCVSCPIPAWLVV